MKRIKFILGSLFGTLVLAPVLALAQATGGALNNNGLTGFLTWLRTIMGMVVPILIGLAVIAFLWGVLQFVFYAGNEDKRKEGKSFMIWGIVGIVVMVSVWGLVNFLQTTFGITTGTLQNGPQLPPPGTTV